MLLLNFSMPFTNIFFRIFKRPYLKFFLQFLFSGCLFLFQQNELSAQTLRVGELKAEWRVLQTPHFEIFYSAQHHDLGLYYANIAELSWQEITTLFKTTPTQKVVVVINDNTDSPNGFTTLLPYPYIMIYPVQASKDDSLAESSEWAKELFIHELAHIFQLCPYHGYYKWLRPIMGNIVAPNLLMPLWWKEGMAVEIETRFTEKGRLRSLYQDSVLRALSEEKKLTQFTLPIANEVLDEWPHGQTPYIFGSLFWGRIGQIQSGTLIQKLTDAQAERVPYFIEQPFVTLTQQNIDSNYLKALIEQEQKSQLQIQTLKETPLTEFNPIQSNLITSKAGQFNSNKNLFALVGNDKKSKRIYLYSVQSSSTSSTINTNNSSTTGASASSAFTSAVSATDHPSTKKNLNFSSIDLKEPPTGDIIDFVFLNKTDEILVNKLENVSSRQKFGTLSIYNYKTFKTQKIELVPRARSPQISDDDSLIYFINPENGQSKVQVFNVQDKTTKTLLSLPFYERVSHLTLLQSKYLIIYKILKNGEQQNIIYNVTDKTFKMIDGFLKNADELRLYNDELYFLSSNNGVTNIYKTSINTLLNPQKKNEQNAIALSNTITQVLDYNVLSGGSFLVATVMTAQGPQSFWLTAPEKPLSLKTISKSFQDSTYQAPLVLPKYDLQDTEPSLFKYLVPQYLIPFISTSTNEKGYYTQLMTEAHDPTYKHQYSLNIGYDSAIKKLSYELSYINAVSAWDILVSTHQRITAFAQSSFFVQRTGSFFGLKPDLFSFVENLNLVVGYQKNKVEDEVVSAEHVGPLIQLKYSTVQQTIYDIYPTAGWAAFFQYEKNETQNNTNGSLYDSFEQLTGSTQLYFSKFLPEQNSLFLKISGLYTPQKVSQRFGLSSSGVFLQSDFQAPSFIVRGYQQGQFFGNNMVSSNLEYRFPFKKLNYGNGSDPYFLKKLNGAFVVDALTLQGTSLDKNLTYRSENMSKIYASVGLEARLETTVGYLLPLNFVMGLHWPTQAQHASTPQTVLSLQIGGFNR